MKKIGSADYQLRDAKSKIPTAYFSHSGNTCEIAGQITKITRSDVKSIILDGLAIRGSNVFRAFEVVVAWLKKIELVV